MHSDSTFFSRQGWLSFVILAAVLLLVLPAAFDIFRLNLIGKYLTYAFVALGLVLCWGMGGILSLGQGIFFGLGGYCMAMFLKLEASTPEWTKREFDPGPKKAYESNDHRANFIDGVKTRKLCICHAEVGHRSITPGHLGLLSESLGGKLLRWDPKTETVVGDEAADRKLKSAAFRKPWVLERMA